MNVRLQYSVDFLAGVYYEGTLKMNSYSVVMNLTTASIDPVVTNVAMDRLKYFVYGVLDSTVFVNSQYKEQAEMLALLGANVTTLPEEPVDQIVGMMLYYKLNAIMEGHMILTGLDISSELGDSVWYQHDEDDNAGPFAKDGWWRAPSLQHDTIDLEPVEDKVVKVINRGWHELGLEWPESNAPSSGNVVVFGNFGRDEN